jgi:hypothetical protein
LDVFNIMVPVPRDFCDLQEAKTNTNQSAAALNATGMQPERHLGVF